MSIAVRIDLDSSTPHYEQLRSQLATLIHAGQLSDGQRLPTVRALANDLGIAAATVTRTYRDLEGEGLVRSRRRVGTLVTAPAPTLERAAVADAADRFVGIARSHGLSDQEIRDFVAAAIFSGGPQVPPGGRPAGFDQRHHASLIRTAETSDTGPTSQR